MAASRRNTSQRLTLVILLLASITVITVAYKGEARHVVTSVRNGAADAISPVQRGVAAVLHPVGNFFAGMADYGGALSENQRLQLEVGQLRRQLIESEQAQAQLDQIRAEQAIPFADGIPEVLAEVISSPSSNFDVTIEIDRGTSDGVGVGMPVVSGAGLVGSVISAGGSTSVVQLVTDPRSDVGVRFGSGNVALAQGQGEGEPLALQDVSETAVTYRGADVVTSGLDVAAYPSGIPVGTVSKVRHPGGSLTSEVQVTPLVNVSELQYVAVLQWLPPA
ncbi:MAG: rod shape-determining protein MreC [Acidimicrobiales bacterium]